MAALFWLFILRKDDRFRKIIANLSHNGNHEKDVLSVGETLKANCFRQTKLRSARRQNTMLRRN